MELSLDWKAYQSAFQAKVRARVGASGKSSTAGSGASILGLIVDGPASPDSVIISAFAEGEDGTEWIGSTPQEVLQSGGARTLWVYSRADIEKVLSQAEGLAYGAHYLDQLERIRREVAPLQLGEGAKPSSQNPRPELSMHFIPRMLSSGWVKVFPSSFGLYFRIEGSRPEKQYFLVFRRGKLEAFFEPDLSSMNPDRRKDPVEVARYLGKSAGVSAQGIQVSASDWKAWAESPHPWKEVAEAIRAERARLLPFRWPVAVWIGTRAIL